ncbi:hypothetical protein J5TS2_12160 [Brevibacillus halotolerans]|nr:hypothetical protein J5TS2_12160 [Brevibacillus halotolerans]
MTRKGVIHYMYVFVAAKAAVGEKTASANAPIIHFDTFLFIRIKLLRNLF